MSRRDLAAVAAIAATAALVSPWVIFDAETYMRLAIGRATVATGPFGQTDPFLFSLPGLRFRNPEWLSDLTFWGLYRAGGEPALIAFKLLVVAAGWTLVYVLARVQGGRPLPVAALTMTMLAASTQRLKERAELHSFWLVPALGLVVELSRRRPRLLVWVPALVALWANLHGSWVLAWVIVGAAFAEALVGERRDLPRARALALTAAALLVAGTVTPSGLSTYALLIEHVRGADAFKRQLGEWMSPDDLPAELAMLPLHAFGALGLASFLSRGNRRQVGALLTFVAGFALAHASYRMIPVFGMLAVPVLAANLDRLQLGTRARWAAYAGLALFALAMVAPTSARAHSRIPVRDHPQQPRAAAEWIAAHVPAGGRLFGPYEAQFLMWAAPDVKLYIHPHFSFDASFFRRYIEEVLPSPARFEEEVRRLDIDLALVDLGSGRAEALRSHLDGSPRWQLVYLDGHYALFARQGSRTPLAAYALPGVRARLDLSYLDDGPAPDAGARERLTREAPRLLAAMDAYRALRVAELAHDATSARAAVTGLEQSLPHLPGSPYLASYLARALLAAGDGPGAAEVVRGARTTWPDAPPLVEAQRRLGAP